MVLHATPSRTAAIDAALAELATLAVELPSQGPPARWQARLRRAARGAAAASSIAIEGFRVSEASAAALVAGDRRPASHDEEVVAAYGRAMDHVVALSDDPQFKWNHRVIADLHFDLAWPDRGARPGRLRTGGMGVTGSTGELEYTAPDAAEAVRLTAELVRWLRMPEPEVATVVRAAMAHLHLVSIHPFEDGNGRVSRVLQSLVLARDGTVEPEFASIEEYLAANTAAYYAALQDAHGSVYDPSRSATGWVEFCLHAHVETARNRVALIRGAARRWATLERLVGERGWPERLVTALEQASTGRLDRASYSAETAVSDATASADLRRLTDAGLLVQEGSGRGTRYLPSTSLRDAIAGG